MPITQLSAAKPCLYAESERRKSRGEGHPGLAFHSEIMPLYLLAAFGKNEQANLSSAEKHQLAKAVKERVAFWRHRNEQGIH